MESVLARMITQVHDFKDFILAAVCLQIVSSAVNTTAQLAWPRNTSSSIVGKQASKLDTNKKATKKG